MTQASAQAAAVSILCIEDEEELLLDLLEELEAAGFSVTGAANGEHGLALLSQYPFAIVLCDIRLPGISGLEVLARIRAELSRDTERTARPHTPCVILSAYDDLALRECIMQSGAAAFLVKPVDYEHLISTIQMLTQA